MLKVSDYRFGDLGFSGLGNSENKDDLAENWKLKTATIGLVIFASLVALELIAWSVFTHQSEIKNALRATGIFGSAHIDPYEMAVSENSGHWRLRPNYAATDSDLIKSKQDAGKWLSAQALSANGVGNAASGLRINSDGFKGEEIDTSHQCPRILMIGDSVTFGLGGASYPEFMEQNLLSSGLGVEIINAGVEGYNASNLLFELPRYIALKPDIVTIYIGWNSVFAAGLNALAEDQVFKTPWLISQILGTLRKKLHDQDSVLADGRIPDRNNKIVQDILALRPIQLQKISHIVDAFLAKGTVVYVVTLPSLFHLDQEPSPEALQMGHLPENVINPYVLAALSRRFNQGLHELARGSDVGLLDLELWGRQNFDPPESYFIDSVHFNVRGLQKLGKFFADELQSSIRSIDKTCVSGSMN